MEMTYASWLSVYIAVRVARPCTAMGGMRHKSSQTWENPEKWHYERLVPEKGIIRACVL